MPPPQNVQSGKGISNGRRVDMKKIKGEPARARTEKVQHEVPPRVGVLEALGLEHTHSERGDKDSEGFARLVDEGEGFIETDVVAPAIHGLREGEGPEESKACLGNITSPS